MATQLFNFIHLCTNHTMGICENEWLIYYLFVIHNIVQNLPIWVFTLKKDVKDPLKSDKNWKTYSTYHSMLITLSYTL